MRLLKAFIKMVRLPNLIFIALTQVLFYECIIRPILDPLTITPAIGRISLLFLVLSSVFIAAAGYIINDYFDINIDQVNKPRQNVIDSIVSRRWAMLWHMIISGAGVLFSIYVFIRTSLWYIPLASLGCVFLLFVYSLSLKQKLLIGNVLISLLTAWVIMVLFLSEARLSAAISPQQLNASHKIIRLGLLYSAFAFIISLIREAIKDMEDIEGDRRYGCQTMPIRWGMNASKVYVALWLVVLIILVIVTQAYVSQFRWWWPNLYSTVLIIFPLGYIFYQLFKASGPRQFHQLSSVTKLVMLTGILSIIFFRFYL
ncbi:MAG: geranylgeranylglycerol-phosphate geranylgeranyltransferase [Bacteroidetes bacterium]|nr:geranylgeranylglycerol-phosphate geranylgeranyltransferase [Bacteroidota bacterium]